MARKKLTIIGLIGLAVIGFTTIIASLFDQMACEGQLINNNVSPTQAQQIWGETIISQSFIAPRDGLNRIDVLFQTYRRRNTHDLTLRLLEVPGQAGNPLQGVELFRASFNAASVSDQFWRTFTFPPIPNSAGKTYLISLASPESVDGDAITVGGIERDVYMPGSAFLGPAPVQADITFRACFEMNVFERLRVLSEQMTRSRPVFWGQAAFYGLWFLLYLILCAGFLGQLARLAHR